MSRDAESRVAGLYPPFEGHYGMPGARYALGAVAGASWFELDEERARYRAEKERIVRAGQRGPFRAAGWSAVHEQLVTRALAGSLAQEQPDEPARYEGLDALAMAVQEDVVVMTRAGSAHDARASYVHVCFPSGWCPRHVCGTSWLAMHAKVPAAGDFMTGEQRKQAAEALFGGEPWVRFVWTLKPEARLDRAGCERRQGACSYASGAAWGETDTAYVRVERQVIVPIREDVSAFLIRVYEYPVQALGHARRAALLANLDAVYRMAASGRVSMAQYKGFPERAMLRAQLERVFASHPAPR